MIYYGCHVHLAFYFWYTKEATYMSCTTNLQETSVFSPLPHLTVVPWFFQNCDCCISTVLPNGPRPELQCGRHHKIFITSFIRSVSIHLLSDTCFQLQCGDDCGSYFLSRVAMGLAFGIASVLWLNFIFNDTVIEIALTLAVSYLAFFTVRYTCLWCSSTCIIYSK